MSSDSNQEGGVLASWATRPHFGPKRWDEASALLGASKEAETHGHQSPCRPGWSHPKQDLVSISVPPAVRWQCQHAGTSRVNEDS